MKPTILFSLALAATLSFAAEAPPAKPAPLPGPDAKGTDPEIVGEEKAVLTAAPNVPPPITRKDATMVIVHLEVRVVV